MTNCPFCGNSCNSGALLCPSCKVELPEASLLNFYRIVLERDRTYFEPANRKKLDALARKEKAVREKAIASARAQLEAEEEKSRLEAEEARRLRAEEALIRQQEFNEKSSKLFKKYGPATGILAAAALVINFVVLPKVEARRLDEKFRGSTVAACSYAREVDTTMKEHYKKLEAVIANGGRFGSYWDKENERITTVHIDKIRSTYVNPSSDRQIVKIEVSEFENEIAYDLNRLRTTFSTYWDQEDLNYYGASRILENNQKFIAWCDERNS